MKWSLTALLNKDIGYRSEPKFVRLTARHLLAQRLRRSLRRRRAFSAAAEALGSAKGSARSARIAAASPPQAAAFRRIAKEKSLAASAARLFEKQLLLLIKNHDDYHACDNDDCRKSNDNPSDIAQNDGRGIGIRIDARSINGEVCFNDDVVKINA